MLAGPVCWVFGNEAHGLEDDDLALADHVVRLPIYGRAESLNLATAASVLLYQTAFRQRRALARRAAAVPGTGR
jgi:TrmH family RNA methyltransferase